MVQPGGGHGFEAQARASHRIRRQMAEKDLDGYLPREPGVFGPINFAHASSTQGGDDFVWAELFAGLEWHLADSLQLSGPGSLGIPDDDASGKLAVFQAKEREVLLREA